MQVILVGDSGVGKTSIVKKYMFGSDQSGAQPTLGIEYHSKTVKVTHKGKDETIKARIWDTAGQERYKAVTGV